MREFCKSLCICGIAASLLFQGCAAVPPRQPSHYPKQPPVRQRQPPPVTEPVMVPSKPVEPKRKTVAADFSSQAEKQIRQGKFDVAASTLERGLRLAPKDPLLWSQLAEVKLRQKDYQQAVTLAAKSNSLAGSDRALMQKNSLIIAEARKRGGGH